MVIYRGSSHNVRKELRRNVVTMASVECLLAGMVLSAYIRLIHFILMTIYGANSFVNFIFQKKK